MRVASSPQQILAGLVRWIFPLLLTCGILFWTLKLWKADLNIPLCYAGDGLCAQAWTKDILDEGWYLDNHYLSYPGSMDMEDYPLSDNLSFLQLKLLGLITKSYGAVFNWFYLLTYPLTTMTSYLVFRRFNISYFPSLLGSLLFTFAPYHFARGEPHILLSAYFLVPLEVMLALWIYQGWNSGVGSQESGTGSQPSRAKIVAGIGICLAVGAGAVYYAFFGCFLLLVAGVWGAWYYRRPRLLGLAFLFVIIISLSTLANLCPTFFYNLRHGQNWECVIRYPFQAQYYALRLDNLVLPPPQFRLARYIQPAFTLGWNFGTYLGLLGTGGFIVLLFNSIIPRWSNPGTLMTSLSHMNLASLLLGVTGGCGFLVAMFLAPWIRCYYRLTIFLSFFAIFALVLVLERLQQTYADRPRLKWVFPVSAFGLLFLGMWDQTNKFFIPPFESTAAEFRSDGDFVRQIEARIPGQAVFQLPYAPFPEFAVHEMNCYDHMRGFLHTRNLRWSGGVVRGRACDGWQRQICSQPAPQMLETLALAGFKGLYIDRFGYADRAKELENELKSILDEDAIVSENQRLVFYDLSDYARDLRAGMGSSEWEARQKQALAGLDIYPAWGRGFYHWEGDPAVNWRWCGPKGKMEIRNEASHPQTIQLEMSFDGKGPRPAQLRIHGSLISENFEIVSGKMCTMQKTITVPPGRHAIEFQCDGERITAEGDPREIVFRVINCRMQVLDAAGNERILARQD